MNATTSQNLLHRRRFVTSMGAGGLGMMALHSLLAQEASAAPASTNSPLSPRAPHFAPRAKRCIFIFLDGGPSQLDLFDRKPKLNELDGQKMPDSILEKVRFAFIKKEQAVLRGTDVRFRPRGQSGMEISDLLPNIATCADDLCLIRTMVTDQFNHHPASLTFQCGQPRLGHPSMGAWLTYGLGSESQSLPGYVVLTGGRGTSGASTLWTSGYLNSAHAGVLFRSRGEPVLNLANPPGVPAAVRRRVLDTVRQINQENLRQAQDAQIAARIASYELAFRMQAEAADIGDLASESRATLDAYGVNREDADIKVKRDGGPGQFRDFATNCLLARRLVERGVRFVNIFHASWDHHENVKGELPFYTQMVDQPIAALIHDLKQRGLLEDTLVVWGSEFGRTPLGQGDYGRDHHPYAFSMFLAGGGVRGGYTHGETDEIGWAPVRDAVHVNDLQATLLHLFGLDHLRLTYRYGGLDQRLTTVTREANVVKELLA